MKLGKYADFVVINVSSPNTPGLRALQGRAALRELVLFVKTARDNLDWGPGGPPPLLVKVAPDLSDADKADVAAVVLGTGVDGLVVSNTTISRPGACVRAAVRRCGGARAAAAGGVHVPAAAGSAAVMPARVCRARWAGPLPRRCRRGQPAGCGGGRAQWPAAHGALHAGAVRPVPPHGRQGAHHRLRRRRVRCVARARARAPAGCGV
jgi:hypothetical protein